MNGLPRGWEYVAPLFSDIEEEKPKEVFKRVTKTYRIYLDVEVMVLDDMDEEALRNAALDIFLDSDLAGLVDIMEIEPEPEPSSEPNRCQCSCDCKVAVGMSGNNKCVLCNSGSHYYENGRTG